MQVAAATPAMKGRYIGEYSKPGECCGGYVRRGVRMWLESKASTQFMDRHGQIAVDEIAHFPGWRTSRRLKKRLRDGKLHGISRSCAHG